MTVLARSDRAIERIAPADKRKDYGIKGVKGLRLVVHPTGRKVWYVVYQQGKGATRKRLWHEIGQHSASEPGWTLERACERCRQFLGTVTLGIDPEAPTTFGELFDLWLEKHKHLATWPTEERRYQLHLQESLGTKRIDALERKDVREIRDHIFEAGNPIESNRVVALFNRVMNWAVDEDRAKFNPAARLSKRGQEQRRENTLEPSQLKALWLELGKPLVVDKREGGLTDSDLEAAKRVRWAIKLLILTGQRRGEVIGIAKSELAGDRWTIPKERTKNGLPHSVPLLPQAQAVIAEATAASGDSPYLFPSYRTDSAIRPDAVTKQLHRMCARMKPKIEGIGPHDIRRTLGTTLRSLGVSVEDRGYLFNHISGAKSKVTSWNYDAGEHDNEKQRAINIWGNYLEDLVTPVNNIVKLRG